MPLRADGFALGHSGLLADGSPPQSRLPEALLPQWLFRTEAPRSQLRDSSRFTLEFPWCLDWQS